jgi:hypothetical protein
MTVTPASHVGASGSLRGLTAPTRREHRADTSNPDFGEQAPSHHSPRPGGDNPSVALADAQQHRLLELLREAAEEPTPFAELHAGGVSFPAAVISELEPNGYPTERVHDHRRLVGVRLLESEPRDPPAAHRRRRRPWPHR